MALGRQRGLGERGQTRRSRPRAIIFDSIDAWGGTDASNGGVVNDLTSMTLPHSNLQWRLPGQRADVAGVVNNGYRTYVPELGLYTSPEPLHLQTSSRFFGVQGYQYAAGRPLFWTDPSGQDPVGPFGDQYEAGWYLLQLICESFVKQQSFEHPRYDIEQGAPIYEGDDGFYYEDDFTTGDNGNVNPDDAAKCYDGLDRIGNGHSHPLENGDGTGDGFGDDKDVPNQDRARTFEVLCDARENFFYRNPGEGHRGEPLLPF